jgi:hypothetical protein
MIIHILDDEIITNKRKITTCKKITEFKAIIFFLFLR